MYIFHRSVPHTQARTRTHALARTHAHTHLCVDLTLLRITILIKVSISVLGSIVVSIPACHAGDRGSIPRRGGQTCFTIYLYDPEYELEPITLLCIYFVLQLLIQ